ncbi:MAG: hypothetical protein RLZZ58_2229 [Pseudomonadota bacterium]|jgi:hypothetical protein
MVMNFSPVETMRDADPAGRAGFDIMLAVASARQASSPTARLSLRLAKQSTVGGAERDVRRTLLAGRRTGPDSLSAMAGCFARIDIGAGTQK